MKRLVSICILSVFVGIYFTVSTFAEEFYVISVQNKCGTCKGIRSSGGRWCDNGDGTITDMTSCLVWLKYTDWGGLKPWRNSATSGESQYDDAHQCAGLLGSGETIFESGETVIKLEDGSCAGDWRLPTKKELMGVITGNEIITPGSPQFFKGVQNGTWWSSTTSSSTSFAWSLWMDIGVMGETIKSANVHIWPVRPEN